MAIREDDKELQIEHNESHASSEDGRCRLVIDKSETGT
jgi:hypothetical protein